MTSKTAFLLFAFAATAAFTSAQMPLEEYSMNHVTHGPMLGLVTENSVRVWARTHKAGDFTVQYGTTEAQLDQTSAIVTTTADHDHTGSITLTGLKPGTMYHYQIYIGKVPSGPAGTRIVLVRSAIGSPES